MVESQRTVIKDADELEKAFKPEITGGVISDKLAMPNPGDEGKLIRIGYVKGKDGSLGVIDRVKNPNFRGPNHEAEFMSVQELDAQGKQIGPEKRMGLGESLKNGFRRIMNEEHWKAVDLPGKVVQITANWWTSAPRDKRDVKVKCKFCGGVGCKVCGNTGIQSPVVFNIHARHDLMSAVSGKNNGNQGGEEF